MSDFTGSVQEFSAGTAHVEVHHTAEQAGWAAAVRAADLIREVIARKGILGILSLSGWCFCKDDPKEPQSRATLHRIGVLMNRSVRSYIGNFGLDVFQQGRAFELDFTAMRLKLETDQ
jgi:hypothetical protein